MDFEREEPDSFLPNNSRVTVSSRPINTPNKHPSPYAGWNFYFPEDGCNYYFPITRYLFVRLIIHLSILYIEYKTSHAIVRKVKAVENFIIGHENLFNEEEIEETKSCTFDLKLFFADNDFLAEWPSFKEDLISDLLNSLNCLGLAIYQVICRILLI